MHATSSSPSSKNANSHTKHQTKPLLRSTNTTTCPKECVTPDAIYSKYGTDIHYDHQLCCSYHEDLKNMLSELNEFFRMQTISYFISSGTLIGSLRHKTIIPWDLDADVYVPVTPNHAAMNSIHLTETYIKLLSWSNVMPQSKYILRPGSIQKGKLITSFKLHRRDQLFIDRLNINGPKIDVQLTMFDGNNAMHIANPYWYQKFAIPKDLIYPLKGCAMYDTILPCPFRSLQFLNLFYGPNVITKAESKRDYWSTLGSEGDGPQRKSFQEKSK